MPFDGNAYKPLLVLPYSTHAKAPATSRALAGSLANSYAFARTNSRLIGQQTSLIFNGDPYVRSRGAGAGLFNGINSTDFVSIAQFRRRLQAHTTVVVAHISGRGTPYRAATIRARIIITDGTDTDTGSAIETPFEAATPEEEQRTGNLDRLAHGDAFTATAYTEIRDVSLPNLCTITVQAHCVDSEDSGVIGGSLFPQVTSCWWESLG